MKVVINGCYGGFGLSEEALKLYRERSGNVDIDSFDIEYGVAYRNDPILVAIVEELGECANGMFASLEIEEIDDRYDYWIEDYDKVMMKKEDMINEVAKAQRIIELLYDENINIDGFAKEDLFELHKTLSKLNKGIIYSNQIESY